MKQANIGRGLGPTLGPWKLWHFYPSNMHSPTLPGTFSSNYLMYICVDKSQNIFFNMKDSEDFGKCNFPFLYLRQSRVLFFHLLLFAETLLCKSGVCHTFNCQICILPLFLVPFLQKFNLHLCRHIYKISISI